MGNSLDTFAWRGLAAAWLRWGIGLAVVIAVVRRILLEKEKLATYDFKVDIVWLLASATCYLAGMAACAVFWRLAMQDAGGRPSWFNTGMAYFAGHLGKYVPGKGLVVVIRSTMVKGSGVTLASAAFTCVIETVLMMATGSLLAALFLPFLAISHRAYLWLISAGMAAGFSGLVLPPISWRLRKMVLKPFGKAVAEASQPLQWVTLATGAGLMTASWLLVGLSLAALLASMGELGVLVGRLGIMQAYALLITLAALATVGGFVSMIPGGLGTREWILAELLGPFIGIQHALVAAVALRLLWLLAEVFAAGIFWLVSKAWTQRSLNPG